MGKRKNASGRGNYIAEKIEKRKWLEDSKKGRKIITRNIKGKVKEREERMLRGKCTHGLEERLR